MMPLLSRRSLGAILCGTLWSEWSLANVGQPWIAVADIPGGMWKSVVKARQRFAIYRNIGFNLLRTEVGWSSFDEENNWAPSEKLISYLRAASESGFGMKLGIDVFTAVPRHFFLLHPDAKIKDSSGLSGQNMISPWYPNLSTLISDKMDNMISSLARHDLLRAVEYIIPFTGPAGEPIYPATWESGHTAGFWCYDPYARESFIAHMVLKFDNNLPSANWRWNTKYQKWADVEIPRPGQVPGAMWEDVLIWYRDSKRQIIKEILSDALAIEKKWFPGRTGMSILLVPGRHVSADEWNHAIATGSGSEEVRVMVDTDFLIDLAVSMNMCIQYTAGANSNEVNYIMQKIRDRRPRIPVAIENNGGAEARNIGEVVSLAIKNGISNFDYIPGRAMFKEDDVTPSDLTREVQAQILRLRDKNPSQ